MLAVGCTSRFRSGDKGSAGGSVGGSAGEGGNGSDALGGASSSGGTGGAGAKASSTGLGGTGPGGTDTGSGGTDTGSGGTGGEANTTSGGASGGTGGDTSTLDCPIDCLPPAPATWTGPSAVYDGPASERPSGCPNQYARKEVEAHQGMSAAPARCTCSEGVVAGERCIVKVARYLDAVCSSGALSSETEFSVPAESPCISVSNAVRFRVAPPEIELGNASCSFVEAATELPQPTFERVNLACGLPVSAACSANPDCTAAPLPDAPFGRLCIHKEGEHACPGSGYDARFVAYRDIEDERACGGCSGDPSGGTCGASDGVFSLYQDAECSNRYQTDVPLSQCYDPPSMAYLDIELFAPAGVSCVGTSNPTGDAESTGPVTFCCVR